MFVLFGGPIAFDFVHVCYVVGESIAFGLL